jgi:hypothetical protein
MSNNCLFGAGYTVMVTEVQNSVGDSISMTNISVFNNKLQIGRWGYWYINTTAPSSAGTATNTSRMAACSTQPPEGFADGQSIPEGLQVYDPGGGSTASRRRLTA